MEKRTGNARNYRRWFLTLPTAGRSGCGDDGCFLGGLAWGSFLLGTMFLLWFLLLRAPRVVMAFRSHDPDAPNEWSRAFIALAMCGGPGFAPGILCRDVVKMWISNTFLSMRGGRTNERRRSLRLDVRIRRSQT